MILVPRQHRIGAAGAARNRAGPPKRANPQGPARAAGAGNLSGSAGAPGAASALAAGGSIPLPEVSARTRMPEVNGVDRAAGTRGRSPVVAGPAAAPCDMTLGGMDRDRRSEGGPTALLQESAAVAGCVIRHRLSSKSLLDRDLFKFRSLQ